MAFAEVRIGTDPVEITSRLTAGQNYIFQNQSPEVIWVTESATKPTEGTPAIALPFYVLASYRAPSSMRTWAWTRAESSILLVQDSA